MVQSSPSRIAVIDDEESVRRALHRLMRAAGLDSVTFGSGREFLDSVRYEAPACIVLDLNMPQMNGFEVHAQLRGLGIDTPVIMITGHDTDESQARCVAIGAFAYLCKPIDSTILLDTIHDAIASGARRKP